MPLYDYITYLGDDIGFDGHSNDAFHFTQKVQDAKG